jgi:hypothetical protein
MENKYFSYITEIKYWKKIILLVIIIAVCYYISLRFIFPGHFDPLIPQNYDYFWTYNGVSSLPWAKVFTCPRPIGFFMLKVVGILGMSGAIIFLILFNFLNILLTIIFVKKISNIKIYWPIILIYLFLIFSQPGFYFNYTYDFFDTIAYFFVIATMLIWLGIGEKLTPILLAFLSILIGLSFFSKETYVVTLLIFWAYQFTFRKNKIRRNAAIMFLITSSIFITVLIHGRLSQNIWIDFASSADSPYFTNFNPFSIWETFCFYMGGWGNAGAISIIALSLLIVVFNKKYLKEFLLLLFMGIAAYVPYSILPNHKYGFYFWLGIPLSYGVIMLAHPDMINTFLIKVKNKKTGAIFNAVFIIVFIVLAVFSLKNNMNQKKGIFWAPSMEMEQVNKNVMSSFPILKNNIEDNDKILITGMDVALHPFSCQHDLVDVYFNRKNDFIENYFGNNHDWTIFKHTQNLDKSCGSISYTNDSNLDLTSYDKIFIFENDEKLMKIVSKDEVMSRKDSKIGNVSYYEAILNPELFNNNSRVSN